MSDPKPTRFAPAERENREITEKQYEKIRASDFLKQVMTGTPFLFFILNDKRQIIFSNEELMRYLGYEKIDLVLGLRPGEAFGCVNSDLEPGGCGTSNKCQYCGAILAILESASNNNLVIKEAILNVVREGEIFPENFEISSKPFTWEEEAFFIVTLQSIAEKKRKEQLERIFFHDIINKAGNVQMFLEILESKGIGSDDAELFKVVKQGMSEMLDDIRYQTKLQKAESGTLSAESETLIVNEIMETVISEYKPYATNHKIKLGFERISGETVFQSDKVLIKRILGNLVKNALEASAAKDRVELECEEKDNELLFYVKNPAVMPEEIQKQLFNRSFSTKGVGRGLGTYSIKLFTEKYLKGKVEFASEKGKGTIFTIRLPWYIH